MGAMKTADWAARAVSPVASAPIEERPANSAVAAEEISRIAPSSRTVRRPGVDDGTASARPRRKETLRAKTTPTTAVST